VGRVPTKKINDVVYVLGLRQQFARHRIPLEVIVSDNSQVGANDQEFEVFADLVSRPTYVGNSSRQHPAQDFRNPMDELKMPYTAKGLMLKANESYRISIVGLAKYTV